MSESEFERLKDLLLGAERAALDAHAARLADLERERQRIAVLEQARKDLPRRLPQLLEWLADPHPMEELSEELRRALEHLDIDELMRRFKETMAEQTERHDVEGLRAGWPGQSGAHRHDLRGWTVRATGQLGRRRRLRPRHGRA